MKALCKKYLKKRLKEQVKKAFTLIEVLVTSIILVLAVTGMIMTFVYCQEWIIDDTNKANATMILNEHFEEIQRVTHTTAMNDLIIPYTTLPKVILKYTSENKFQEYKLKYTFMNIVSPTPTAPLPQIKAEVSWESSKGIKKLDMNLILNNPE